MEREGAEDRLPIGHLRRLPRKEHLASTWPRRRRQSAEAKG
jgi:hypothetical protein